MHQLLKATVSHRPASPDSLNLARLRARAHARQQPPSHPSRPTAASFKLESRCFAATCAPHPHPYPNPTKKLVTTVTFQIGSHSPAMFAREMRKGTRVSGDGNKMYAALFRRR